MDVATLGMRVDSSDLRRGTQDLNRFGQAGDQASRSASALGTAAKAAGAAVAALGAGALFGAAIRQANEFELALAEVSTLMNATPALMSEIEAATRDLAKTYGSSATQQVAAYYQAVSAGAEAGAEATQLLDTANKLATGGVSNVTTAVDILTTAVNAYGKENLSAVDASDALFTGVRLGKTTIDQLAGSLGTVIPIAKSAGVSFDEVVAVTAALTTQGLSTAEAATGVRAALSNIIKPSEQAAAAMEALNEQTGQNLEFSSEALREKGLETFLSEIIEAADGSEAVLSQLFGSTRGLTAILSLAGEGGEALSRTLEELTDKAGATDEAFDKIAKTYTDRMNAAMSRFADLNLSLGLALQTVVVPAMEATATALEAIAPVAVLMAENMDRIAITAGVAAGVMAAVYAPAMYAAAAGALAAARAAITLRGAIIRTGLGVLVVLVGEAIFWFMRFVEATGSVGAAMSLLKDLAVEVWERIKMGAAAAGAAATAMFFDLKADAASGMQSAIESVVAFGNTAANTFEGAFEAIKATWGALPEAIGDLAFQAANSLIDGVEAMLNGVVSRINGFIGGINQGLEAIGSERRISLVPDLDLSEIENRFEGAATAATTAAQTAFDRAFEDDPLIAPDLGLAEAANRALESVNLYRSAARDLAEGARAPLSSLQALRDATEDVATETTATSDAVEALTDETQTLDTETRTVTDTMTSFGSAGVTAGDQIAQAMQDAGQSVRGLGDQLSGVIGSLARGDLSGALRAFGNSATSAFGNSIKGWLNGIGGAPMQGPTQSGAPLGGGGLFGGLGLFGLGGGSGLFGLGAGSGLGATLSAAMPVIGAVIAGVSLVKGLVGETAKNFNFIDVTAGAGGITGNAGDNKTTSNMFGSSTNNNYEAFGTPGAQTDKVAAQIREEWDAMRAGITEELQMIGLDTVDFLHAIRIEYSDALHGNALHDELIAQLRGELDAAGDEMIRASLAAAGLARDGESGAQALQIVVGSFDALTQALDLTNQAVMGINAETLRWARELTDLSGGVAAFTANFNAFYQSFYTEQERAIKLVENTTEAMRALGFAMPEARNGFRDLVLAQDLTTAAGREAYASLLALSGQMDQVFTDMENGVERLANAVSQTLQTAFAEAYNKLTAAQNALTSAAQAAAKALDRRLTDAFRAVTGLIDDELRGLSDTARDVGRRLDVLNRALEGRGIGGVAETLMARASAMAELQAGISDTDRLQSVVRTLNEPSAQLFGSFRDYAVDFARTSAVIRDQRDAAADQLSETEQQIAALEATRAAIEAQYDAVRGIKALTADSLDQAVLAFEREAAFYKTQMAQLDGLLGQGDTIAGLMAEVRDAMARVEQATLEMGRAMEVLAGAIINSLQRIGGTGGLQGLGSGAFGAFAADGSNAIFSQVGQDMLTGTAKVINDLYLDTFGRAADALGTQFYGDLLESGQASINRVAYDLQTSDEAQTGVTPGFGTGLSTARPTDPVAALYGTMLGREPDPAGLEFWRSTGLSGDALINAFRDGAAANGDVPKFARGGMHTGGLRIVGENGPELEHTGPSRIYSSGDTRRMLDNREMVEELRALRKEVNRLSGYSQQTTINTGDTARRIKRFDIEGLPAERTT